MYKGIIFYTKLLHISQTHRLLILLKASRNFYLSSGLFFKILNASLIA